MIAQEIDKLIAAGADLTNYDTSPFIIVLQTIPSRFYPLYMMFVSLLTALLQREFGPMLRAERRARHERKLVSDAANVAEVRLDADLEPQPHTPQRWWNAAIPIAVVVALVVGGMVDTGLTKANAKGVPKNVINIFSNASSFKALVWGSFTATVVTAVLYWLQYEKGGKLVFGPLYWFRRRSGARPLLWLGESLTTIVLGIKGQTAPILILILAWSLSGGIGRLGTGRYIASALAKGMDPRGLPSLVFLLASVLSFAIGSSWGTMALLFPIAVPAAYYGAPGNASLLNTTISAILAGAVFGDQCSPLSDTTILSAAASKCDLRHHIYTQLPYALVVASLAVLLGYLPVGFGAYPAWAGILIGLAAILLFLFGVCKGVADPQGPEDLILAACHKAKVLSLDTVDRARARLAGGGGGDDGAKDAAASGGGYDDGAIVVDEDVGGPLDWWSRFTAERRRSSFLGRNDLVVVGHRAGSEINSGLSRASLGSAAAAAGSGAGSPDGIRYRSRSAVGAGLPQLGAAGGAGPGGGRAGAANGKAAGGEGAV
ncbi:hypothetical protein Rsub_10239 [Raphidocelis subcapitata]|uniref:Na+/H+ antiporter NhaC-like C-terminal domain-containing protein n=1 Tax=Raphidocelis subcapitata TaxID=307507 RepID=A0A2V0PDG1_9CHLO|nr:hypothetical protein Rsub_10239 [Raphidocelis subcapitata]|eukprot:GBF97884.1 hypothetical protein Rsub_10239 [Raphidocelis subcapitata]